MEDREVTSEDILGYVEEALLFARAGEQIVAALNMAEATVRSIGRLYDMDNRLHPEVSSALDAAKELAVALEAAGVFISTRLSVAEEKLEPMSEASTDVVVLPATGEVVDLNDSGQVARAYREVRELEEQLKGAKAVLTEALVVASQIEGSKTLHTGGGKVVVKGGQDVVWNAQELKRDLLAAGMPAERVRDIVVETIEYRVVSSEAKRAAAANPAYAAAVASNRTTYPKRPYVSVSEGGSS